MTKRTFTGRGGETWEWEETPEVVAALKQLHISSVATKLNKPHPFKNEQSTSDS
tara:strand:+ start:1863 stop:2024 length:162 start_codon:yes stop_codon:yes gene_type:complete